MADSFEGVEQVFWKGSAREMQSVLDQDLDGLSGKEKEQRILRYWRELTPANGSSPVADLDQQLVRIASEGAGNGVDGTELENGFFVRKGRTENEARVEALRTWIVISNRDLLPDLIKDRLSDERVWAIDLITLDAINSAFVDSTTGLQPLRFWIELYRKSKNPAFRLMAVVKSNDAVPESFAALSSESNEWTFAILVSRKRAFEKFAKDSNQFIAEFSAKKLERISRAVTDMAGEFNYSEGDVLDLPHHWTDIEAFQSTPAPSFQLAESSDSKHRRECTVNGDDANRKSLKLLFVIGVFAVLGILLLLIRAFLRGHAS